MNRKTIKAILVKKLGEWMESITDKEVQKLVRENTLVTGGCIASMLLKEDVKDFDVYFKNGATALAVAKYYCEQFNKENPGADMSASFGLTDLERVVIRNGKNRAVAEAAAPVSNITEEPFEDVFDKLPEDSKKGRYSPLFVSSNAITLTNQIQLVIRFYGSADEVHENFDFVHCMNYFDFGTGELVLRPDAMEALLAKELVYKGSKYPLCSVIRTRKYLKRGFNINAGQYLKMCFQLSQLDLSDVEVLRDQCVGVDSAYFMAVIDGLQAKKDQDPDFKVTNSYLAAIIDRVF